MVENWPTMEGFGDKGLEVLILTDPVDEVWVDQVGAFDGKPLQSIAKGQVDLDSEDEKTDIEPERAQQQKDFAALLIWLTGKLAAEVKEVRRSSRLTSSPACIVGDAQDMTPTLEKMDRAMGQEMPNAKRILEINPTHPLVRGMRKAQD